MISPFLHCVIFGVMAVCTFRSRQGSRPQLSSGFCKGAHATREPGHDDDESRDTSDCFTFSSAPAPSFRRVRPCLLRCFQRSELLDWSDLCRFSLELARTFP